MRYNVKLHYDFEIDFEDESLAQAIEDAHEVIWMDTDAWDFCTGIHIDSVEKVGD